MKGLYPSYQQFVGETDSNGIMSLNISYTFKQTNVALLMATVQLHAVQPPNSLQLPPAWLLKIRGNVRSFSYGFNVDLGPRIVLPSEPIVIELSGAPANTLVTGILHGAEADDYMTALYAGQSLIPNTPVVNLSVGAFDTPIVGRTRLSQAFPAGVTPLQVGVPGQTFELYGGTATVYAAGGAVAPVNIEDDSGALPFWDYMVNNVGNVPPFTLAHPYPLTTGAGIQLNNASGAPFSGSVVLFWGIT